MKICKFKSKIKFFKEWMEQRPFIVLDWSKNATFPGILRDKTMYEKFIYILNDDKQNYPFCTFEILVEIKYNSPNKITRI